MAHSILGDDRDRNNLFDFDRKKFLHDYPGRVVDEVTEALSLIEDQKTRLLGASRLATAPFAPFFQTAYRQAGDVLAPFVNRQQQAFIDIQNQFAEQQGLPQREYEPITGEQLALPIAAAGSLLRGKFPTWFSPASRAVTKAPQQKGDLNYWLGRIKKEKGGTSEAKQLGLVSTQGEATESLLSAAPGTLTKEEALSLIEPIELEETVLQYPEPSDEIIEGVVQEGPDYSLPQHADNEKINLPGGENPREILIQLPPPEHINRGYPYVEPGVTHFTGGHYDDPNVLVHIRINERIVGGKKTLHIEEIQSDWHQQGQKQGYLKPPLSIDEIELEVVPREQAMRESGNPKFFGENIDGWRNTQGYPLDAPVTRYRLKGDEEWSIHFKPGYTREEVVDHAIQKYKMGQLEHESSFEERIRASNQGVPDAPYKKTWHELGWKRAFIEALRDPSIERLTWTTGDVQADRYDLSKYIDSIEAQAIGDHFQLVVDYKEVEGAARKSFPNVSRDELAGIVGKEMADKIVNEVVAPNPQLPGKPKTYSGLDLKIGGEFHKQLYDQKITKFGERFLKQFGVEPQRYKPGEWEVFDARTGEPYRYFDTEEEANAFIDTRRNKYHELRDLGQIDYDGSPDKFLDYEKAKGDFWKINITPEMRETYEGGVPLAMREDEEGLLGRYA
jgi:hypothetical protein